MENRIQKIIDYYQLTSNSFAQEINVNRSTISHILSGRNKPSVEVLQKILKRFSDVSSEWLLLGVGQIHHQKIEKEVVSSKATIPNEQKNAEKILVFYSDGTFLEYHPSK